MIQDKKEQDRNSFFFFFLYILELHYTPYLDIKKPTSAKIDLNIWRCFLDEVRTFFDENPEN